MDPQRLHRILRQHVRTEQLLGIESVPVAASAESTLESLQEEAVEAAPMAVEPEAALVAVEVAEEHATPAAPPRFAAPPAPVATAPPRSPLFTGEPVPKLDRAARLQLLEAMSGEVSGCTKCGLCRGRLHAVFGEGDCEAQLMFVGEGPGQTEDETGRPFVGAAGQLLDKMIVAMGLTRERVYIANTVKCRPPNNRAPLPDETDACWPYLRQQIEAIQPRVIVTLGGPATKLLLQTERGITSIRGIWGECRPSGETGPTIRIMPTFHPAYLLRSYTKENRAKVWSDLQRVMEFLRGPV